jgi:hypothetical protein
MKRINIILSIVTASVLMLGCIKNEPVVFNDKFAEIDQTTYNSNAAGLTYPILTRVPAQGRAVAAACPDSVLNRFTQNIRVRINLVGAQSTKEETVGYKIFNLPSTAYTRDSITIPATTPRNDNGTGGAVCPLAQTPSRVTGFLPATNAVAGTHFRITSSSGVVTIPANSSFGYIDIQILNTGTSSTQVRTFGIELDGSGSLKPNPNYSKIGFVIDQR